MSRILNQDPTCARSGDISGVELLIMTISVFATVVLWEKGCFKCLEISTATRKEHHLTGPSPNIQKHHRSRLFPGGLRVVFIHDVLWAGHGLQLLRCFYDDDRSVRWLKRPTINLWLMLSSPQILTCLRWKPLNLKHHQLSLSSRSVNLSTILLRNVKDIICVNAYNYQQISTNHLNQRYHWIWTLIFLLKPPIPRAGAMRSMPPATAAHDNAM